MIAQRPARRWLRGSTRHGLVAMLAMACIATGASLAIAPLRAAAGEGDTVNPYANDVAAARAGEELFARNCQQCHNSRGKGGKGPQLVRGAWGPGGANSDLFMYQTITIGRPGTEMGSFATSLTNDEIWQVVAFLRAEALRVKAAAAKAPDEEIPW